MTSSIISAAEEAAIRNAEAVRSFWHLRGYVHVTADAWPVPGRFTRNDQTTVFGVRSNLRNGLPPGAKADDVATFYQAKEMPFA